MPGLRRPAEKGRNYCWDSEDLVDIARQLVGRFNKLSSDYPLLRLVLLRRPRPEHRVCVWWLESDNSVQKGYRSMDQLGPDFAGVPIVEGRYAPDKGVGYLLGPEHVESPLRWETAFAMPHWDFEEDTYAWQNGVWAMWFHRDHGRDPQNPEPVPQELSRSLACLEEYHQELSDAGKLAEQIRYRIGLPDWPKAEGILPPQFSKPLFDFDALLWCLFLFTRTRHEVVAPYSPDVPLDCSPHTLWIIEKVGALSAEFLLHEIRRLEAIDDNEPLQQNDRDILVAMLVLNATSINPVSGDIILRKGLCTGGQRAPFARLRKRGLVRARTNVGRWLTLKGVNLAKSLAN